jgi:MoaA/NifB/PqqE/SkfB family radical SAM enzyme
MPRSTDPLARLAGRVDWIELVTGFACNCRCRVCSSGLQVGSTPLDYDEMADWLARGRELGATAVWLGGGEPTLHADLPRTIARARSLGYRRVRVQSNGLRLAYPAYVASLVQAGMTEVALSVKGWNAKSHDAMVRRDGTWELLAQAFDNLRASAVRVEADVLLTVPLLPHLADLVQELARRGAKGLTFWLVSLHGLPDDAALIRLIPPLGGLRAPLREAFARTQACGLDATSMHTPPCALAPEDRDRYLHAGRYRLLVVVPGGQPFMAEESPMERGLFPKQPCRGCAARKDCLGLRADQLRLHGTAKLTPVPRVRRRRP